MMKQKDGYEQDKMLAALFFNKSDGHRAFQSRFDSIRDVDLSLSSVFRKSSFVDRVQIRRKRIHNRGEQAESQLGRILENINGHIVSDEFDEYDP